MVALSAEYLGEPRFRMTEIEGYGQTARGNNYTQATSFHIVDRAYCCALVWSEYAQNGGHGPMWARRYRANAKCDELNARHA